MEYTATVDFVSAINEDDLIDHFATHSGSLGEARDGYRAVFSVNAESFDDAVTSVMEIATAVGTVDALSVAPPTSSTLTFALVTPASHVCNAGRRNPWSQSSGNQ
ncbi:hypothetical protein [Trueperella pyogenes]|uniref:hypothetical protein n=1 Tax=Trueperella pyogenes TaxID=1661 RepID=UPI00345D3373